jgi:hypothetical protein
MKLISQNLPTELFKLRREGASFLVVESDLHLGAPVYLQSFPDHEPMKSSDRAKQTHFSSNFRETGGSPMPELMLANPVELTDAELDVVAAGQISLGNLINVNVSNLLNNTLNHDLNNVLNGSLNNLLAASTINILSGDPITVVI